MAAPDSSSSFSSDGGVLASGPRLLAAALIVLCSGRGGSGSTATAPDARGPVLFPILDRGRWGYIDSTGRVAIPARYESIVAAEPLLRIAEEQPRGSRPALPDLLMSSDIGPESALPIGVKSGGKWGLVDQHGARVGTLRFEAMEAFLEGRAQVLLGDLWGYVNEAGLMAVPAQFDQVGPMRDGLGVVSAGGMAGVVDRDGHFVLRLRFQSVAWDDSVFHGNRVAVRMDSLMGYVNRAGSVVIPAVFLNASRFSEGLAAVTTESGTGYVDTLGHMVIAPRFEAGAPFDGGVARVQAGGLYGLIDRTGAFIARPRCEEIAAFSRAGRAAARRGNKLGFLERTGHWRETGAVELEPLDDSLAIGKVRGKTGIMLWETGKMIQPFPWEDVEPFSEALAAVRNHGTRYGFIDPAGSVVIPPRFDNVDRFRSGLCKAVAGDTVGYVQREGRWVWFARFPGYHDRFGGYGP